MHWLTRGLVVLAIGTTAVGREARAGQPDAAELAALIDRHVESRLEAEHVRPADRADDAEFLRRVYLDLHGVIPSAEQAASFLADTDPAKRAKLIDTLLASPRYGEFLGDMWQGYLVSPLADDYRVRADRFRQWLADRFNTKTWDRIATDLLTATGKLDENPAVIYLVEGRLPRTVPDLTDLASRYFLGIRLNCAQCHDHPFVHWKQQDFWGMAAFFTQVQTPGKPKLVYQVGVKDYPEITLASLKDGGMIDGFQPRPPTFLGGEEFRAGKGTTNRAALAEWMSSPKNPYFARAIVNRTWWRLFGRGIVNPVDDMHAANPPSHPELLDLLSRRFVESGFDLKFLTRAIASSRAYQRTSRPGEAPEKQAKLFGRMAVKVLSAGQLYDSLVTAVGPPTRTPGADPRLGARPEFTQFFGEDGDPDPTTYHRGIPHLLRQMNSGQFAGRNLAALSAQVAKPGRSPDDIAGDLFLRLLSRRPTADEQRLFRDHLTRSDSAESACRELAWALMMTSEFSLNH
jgi:Protein of unknown function (DUF1549)/Protein of unknown function (DUF1553)